ncbi:helix-turn-helix transcriptional regulator (plasmid) [Metabacillus halosaccharovorans]|uniref:helix-turn-helix domain-containing protein n=1 Tax=Metabacillus halosaccharovorans TaxID=930124 RepID=UPI000C80A7FD|nr:helix-turn-helix transcriptional regulator [Metabacillus halosaccharovorans]MBU7595885.1 helix-turn-helix transcriptional regulator [Metabacillus halosaccharovorans]PMC36262.1 XRE family transcriptional regulator [Bacillus sp. UMB0899]
MDNIIKEKLEIKKKFGLNVRRYRLIRNISQEELGELTGLHRTYISSVERGKQNISLENIYLISSALNVKISTLLDFD